MQRNAQEHDRAAENGREVLEARKEASEDKQAVSRAQPEAPRTKRFGPFQLIAAANPHPRQPRPGSQHREAESFRQGAALLGWRQGKQVWSLSEAVQRRAGGGAVSQKLQKLLQSYSAQQEPSRDYSRGRHLPVADEFQLQAFQEVVPA